jgi:membrane protein DedA with SNARE-associated domain
MRHGDKIIVFAQFVPVLRSIAGILAGANRMPWARFMVASIIGVFLWATFYGLIAYSLGRQFERLSGRMMFGFAIVILILIAAAATFVRRHEAQLTIEGNKALPGPLNL